MAGGLPIPSRGVLKGKMRGCNEMEKRNERKENRQRGEKEEIPKSSFLCKKGVVVLLCQAYEGPPR